MNTAFNELSELMSRIVAQEVYVPEWKRKVHFAPQTAHEVALSRKLIESDAPVSELNVALVVIKALNSDGSKMFDPENFQEMIHWKCSLVFDRLAEKMRAATTVEEAKGLSPAIQS
jgi:hypothetical protein